MSKVSVDIDIPSPYIESDTLLHRFKRKLTYHFAFKLLKKYLSRTKDLSFLEIGTGSGLFLQFAHAEFHDATFVGLEYDERLLEKTKGNAPFAICQQGNAETFDLGEKKFDVVVSFQVIEHLFDPGAMLNSVYRHLQPGGIFLVTSPNLDGFGVKVMGGKWHGYREDHVNLKGIHDWNHLIASHGFEQLYSGSTFFSGIPVLNRMPLGVFNWMLLLLFGSARWSYGEAYVAVFKRN
jgi:2-polyprenyl-3-methyl-5-hydroxy-6-metoxy-1,4-benzoquinol methylase